MEEKGAQCGCVGDQISWPIDLLSEGDVYVADVFGKIVQGPIIGDNLSTAIYTKSGNGVVHDAAVRDIDGIRELDGFTSFVRGVHPSYASPTIMLTGVNTAVRIGNVTVIPGDVVLGRGDGVIFIPPHLVRKVVRTSQLIRLRDQFGKQRLRERKYTPGQIDRRWTNQMDDDFFEWVQEQAADMPFPMEEIQAMLKERTW
jgi:regulator of RNase E activity RraA